MNISIISVASTALEQVRKIQEKWQKEKGKEYFHVDLFYIGKETLSEESMRGIFNSLAEVDIVLLDLMGAPQDFRLKLAEKLQNFPGHIIRLNNPNTMGGKTRSQGDDYNMPHSQWLGKYWRFCSEENICNMLYLLGREYLGYEDLPVPQPPNVIEDICILDPDTRKIYENIDEYKRENKVSPDKPWLGLLFNHNNYPVDTFPIIGQFLEKLRKHFNVIPIAMTRILDGDLQKLREILQSSPEEQVDVVINFLAFRLGQGPVGGDAEKAVDYLKELNVPVLHPFFLTKRTTAEWQEDLRGAKSGEFLISIFLPELDGCIETYPIGALSAVGGQFGSLALMDDRAEQLCQRALVWVKLRKKVNEDKKVALIFYNYPPGESNIGSGAFLDTFASLERILGKLKEVGYAVHPWTKAELKDKFIKEGRINTPQWHKRKDSMNYITVNTAEYKEIVADCPEKGSVVKRWGQFPGNIMAEEKSVVIPGIVEDNLFIGVQPSRGSYEENVQNYHDKYMPPHHQYLAFYKWLEQEFKADVCIHVGTHGTLEFLPGKEVAVSGKCFSDYLLGNMPHLYIYYSGNPAEAMLAKRRARAMMISHLHPPFVESGLYGDMLALEALINEYEEALHMNNTRCEEVLKDIKAKVSSLGWTWEDLETVEETIFEMKTSLIPGRLHTFGQPFGEKEITDFLVQLFHYGEDEIPSLSELLCQERDWEWEKIKDAPYLYQQEGVILEAERREWINKYVLGQGELVAHGKRCWEKYNLLQKKGRLVKKLLNSEGELQGLLAGMAGQYIPAGLGGDVFRQIEVLPSGRNIYQFDPRRVPSPSALRKGQEIAENTLRQYQEKTGAYPNSVAVVLWGLETSKTQGETVGQILAYLGVRIKRGKSLWEPQLEVIPLQELGRPRIDVKVQMCGFFRDMFANVMDLLNEAFTMVGSLKEEGKNNFVQTNSSELLAILKKQGLAAKEAQEFACARIFGPQLAQYGTGVNQLVKSRRWQEESDLTADYLQSLRCVYTKNHYGKEMKELLKKNLVKVDVISQVRSSRDYEITDLDHYYEFFGGLAKTVEEVTGKKAMMLISDTHNGKTRTESVQRSIQRGARTRLFNPQWLGAMLAHDYHGGQQLADRLENMLGLAATTGEVDNCLFDEANEKFVLDEQMRNKIQENNPYALQDIMERLLEANVRGYWDAEDDKLKELKNLYLQLEGDLEGESE